MTSILQSGLHSLTKTSSANSDAEPVASGNNQLLLYIGRQVAIGCYCGSSIVAIIVAVVTVIGNPIIRIS